MDREKVYKAITKQDKTGILNKLILSYILMTTSHLENSHVDLYYFTHTFNINSKILSIDYGLIWAAHTLFYLILFLNFNDCFFV